MKQHRLLVVEDDPGVGSQLVRGLSAPTLHNFDLNLLVLFDALYRERQLTAAAAALGLSQPAASQALARLRDAFGDPLFVRRGRRMEPTAQAQILAPSVRDSLRGIEQTLNAMRSFDPASSEREFRIGLGEIGETVYFPRLLVEVLKIAPRVRLRSVTRALLDVQSMLARGDLDLGFDFEPPSHATVRHRALGEEEFVVIARRDHPRVRGSVTLEAYLAEPRIRIDIGEERMKRLLSVLGSRGFDEGIVATVSHLTSIPAIVQETDTLAVVPRSLAMSPAYAGKLQVIEPPIPLFKIPVFAHWHEKFEDDPGHRWLRSLLVEGFWNQAG
jgi:DNA-binding transcriptional LysR family regulator